MILSCIVIMCHTYSTGLIQHVSKVPYLECPRFYIHHLTHLVVFLHVLKSQFTGQHSLLVHTARRQLFIFTGIVGYLTGLKVHPTL